MKEPSDEFKLAFIALSNIRGEIENQENVKMKFGERGAFFKDTAYRIGAALDALLKAEMKSLNPKEECNAV